MLRFLADEYDDTCSTVFPFLSTLLSSVSLCFLSIPFSFNPFQYKRNRKVSSEPLDENKRTFLVSLLKVLLDKLKWNEDPNVEEADEDDVAEFEKMRKVT